jgi:ribosomal protein S21
MLEKLEDFSAFGVLSRDSLFREMRLRGHYEKPSERKRGRRRKLSAAPASSRARKCSA